MKASFVLLCFAFGLVSLCVCVCVCVCAEEGKGKGERPGGRKAGRFSHMGKRKGSATVPHCLGYGDGHMRWRYKRGKHATVAYLPWVLNKKVKFPRPFRGKLGSLRLNALRCRCFSPPGRQRHAAFPKASSPHAFIKSAGRTVWRREPTPKWGQERTGGAFPHSTFFLAPVHSRTPWANEKEGRQGCLGLVSQHASHAATHRPNRNAWVSLFVPACAPREGWCPTPPQSPFSFLS